MTDEEKADQVLEYLGFTATVIGILQGKIDSMWLPHDVLIELDRNEIMGPDYEVNIFNLILYLKKQLGNEQLTNLLATLVTTDLLGVNYERYVNMFQPADDAGLLQ